MINICLSKLQAILYILLLANLLTIFMKSGTNSRVVDEKMRFAHNITNKKTGSFKKACSVKILNAIDNLVSWLDYL